MSKEPNIVNGFNFDELPIKCFFVAKTKRKDWDCFEWRVEIDYKNGQFTTPYYCGLGHCTKPKQSWANPQPIKPKNSDIMFCLLTDAGSAESNFHDWCADFGYSDDSISALNTYKACLDIATRLSKAFTKEQLAAMREALRDY